MNKIILITFLFFACFTTFSQRLEVNIGPVMDNKEVRRDMDLPSIKFVGFKPVRYSTSLFFNTEAKKTYSGFGFSGGTFAFIVLDNYTKYGGVRKLSAERLGEDQKVNLHAFITVNGKMYVFYSQKFEGRDEFSMYVNEVSPDMVLLGSPIIIQNYKNLKQYNSLIEFSLSKNKKHIMITRVYDGKAKEQQKIACKVIDESFTEVWNREFELNNIDKELILQSAEVDNSGNLFLLAEYTTRKISEPILYSYIWKTKSLKAHKVGMTLGENFGASLELLNGEKPYVVGLNQQKKKISYFVNRLNIKGETLERLSTGNMPEDFYKTSDFRSFETKQWKITQTVSLANNDLVASIEAHLVKTQDGKIVSHLTYNTYLLSFKEDGSFKWTHTIQKKQESLEQLIGHILVPASNNVLVLYNDHPDNIDRNPTDKKVKGFTGMKQAMITVQEIDQNGKVSKYPFSKDKGLEDFCLDLSNTAKIQDNFYYAGTIHIMGWFSREARSATFKVK